MADLYVFSIHFHIEQSVLQKQDQKKKEPFFQGGKMVSQVLSQVQENELLTFDTV